MKNENQIIEVKLSLTPDGWVVAVTKEFAPQYGGGSEVFRESGGAHVHRALDVARGMVTLSPGTRTGHPNGIAEFDPNPATNRRLA